MIEDSEAAQNLVKFVAHEQIKILEGQTQKDMSLQFDVLCEQTALVGVVKQKDQSSGQIKESSIQFERAAAPEQLYHARAEDLSRSRTNMNA